MSDSKYACLTHALSDDTRPASHYFFSHGAKLMGRFFPESDGVISSWMASKTALNLMSYFFSSAINLLDNQRLGCRILAA
jgi:hypothetical protein